MTAALPSQLKEALIHLLIKVKGENVTDRQTALTLTTSAIRNNHPA